MFPPMFPRISPRCMVALKSRFQPPHAGPRRLAGLVVAFALLGLAQGAQAESLGQTFRALPQAQRVAVQRELARADLFLAETDGDWSAATERALLRSVETLAQKTGDRLHPRLSDPGTARGYLTRLGAGSYSQLLYGGSLIQRIFFLDEVPLSALEG